MSKTTKNLSMNLVKKQVNQKFKDKKKVIFDGVSVDIDVVFRPSRRNLLTAEFMDIVHTALIDNKKIDSGVVLALGTALIIKHFTSIETDAEGYDGIMEMLDYLKDGGYLEKIISSFEGKELETIFEEIEKTFKFVTQELKKEVDKIRSTENNAGEENGKQELHESE
ncbi:hypothetical protein [Paenibacillus naphthalenovorans]|uniref:Uncharacterized protein n=1 Tax=Paenibacillus naphthalenovorans TaxID=162209 RepID=A0A0U2U7Z6_9BACL|nr:hypothetical protein [Paenibacillus naphthalenovorans]ALS22312.1 hypothetical protein IJ22_19380 [Paenibacillus naphthalenovorans]